MGFNRGYHFGYTTALNDIESNMPNILNNVSLKYNQSLLQEVADLIQQKYKWLETVEQKGELTHAD